MLIEPKTYTQIPERAKYQHHSCTCTCTTKYVTETWETFNRTVMYVLQAFVLTRRVIVRADVTGPLGAGEVDVAL